MRTKKIAIRTARAPEHGSTSWMGGQTSAYRIRGGKLHGTLERKESATTAVDLLWPDASTLTMRGGLWGLGGWGGGGGGGGFFLFFFFFLFFGWGGWVGGGVLGGGGVVFFFLGGGGGGGGAFPSPPCRGGGFGGGGRFGVLAGGYGYDAKGNLTKNPQSPTTTLTVR